MVLQWFVFPVSTFLSTLEIFWQVLCLSKLVSLPTLLVPCDADDTRQTCRRRSTPSGQRRIHNGEQYRNHLYGSEFERILLGDFNPIHINLYFSDFAALPGTITHGMWPSAATRRYVGNIVAEGNPDRVIA